MNTTLLHPGFLITTIEAVYSRQRCAELVCEAEALGFTDAPINTSSGAQRVPEVRNNTRVMYDDPVRTAELWPRIAPHVPPEIEGRDVVGLNERFRVYRYTPGQRFLWHGDGAFHRDRYESSELSLLVYLNEGFEGGETEFNLGGRLLGGGAPLSVRPQTAMALLFLHRVRHQGAIVRSGVKYVLRTDVMYRDRRR